MKLAIEDMRKMMSAMPWFISASAEHDAEYNQTRLQFKVSTTYSTTVSDEALANSPEYLEQAAYWSSRQLIRNLKQAIEAWEHENTANPVG